MPKTVARSRGVSGFVALAGFTFILLAPAGVEGAEFYAGKTITMSTHSAAGGGYDTYLRLLARHFGEHIPGNPNIVVMNQPGAGGLLSANYAGLTAPQDGTFLTLITQALPMLEATGQPGLHISLKQFHWIGNLSKSNNITVTWKTSGIAFIDDAKRRVTNMAGSGAGSISATFPLLLNYLFGTKFKPIIGYEGGAAMKLAMQRGEVDGRSIDTWASYQATEAADLKAGNLNIILQVGLEKEPDLPNVPLLTDIANVDPDREALARFVTYSITATRPLAAPPGTPADRIEVLRTAFDATMKDPDFLADAQKIGAEISPMSGAQVDQLMQNVFSTKSRIIDLFKQATRTSG